MRVDYCKSVQRGKTYTSVLIRHAIRVNGKVKHITIANLTKMPKDEIEAIEWALKNKENIKNYKNTNIKRKAGKKFGAVYLVNEITKKLGIDKALGKGKEARLALLQIIHCVIEHGSCLSAARMAKENAISEVLKISKETSEDDLYGNLSWLSHNQKTIERKLFKSRYKDKQPEIFLYDVTSSYFEGQNNKLADWGYNRDKKKGKKQVVAGLLCDERGYPFSIELFKGNTLDFTTVSEQIKMIANEFGCGRICFVGDRGMIKTGQVEELESAGFHYITAITKPQIETLLQSNILQMGLFDEEIKEVEHNGIRYIIKRNPARAKEISYNREGKEAKIKELINLKNKYLSEHKKAQPETAINKLNNKIEKLKTVKWLRVEVSETNSRELILKKDQVSLAEESKLDGCYVIKSNLPKEVVSNTIHDRYKDLKYVEHGFRTMKTDFLEMRPWYVRKEESTRGRAFVVMLAYMVIKYLQDTWKEMDITVEEGIKILDSLRLLEVKINTQVKYNELPELNETMAELADLSGIKYPEYVPYLEGKVYNRKKLERGI
jgi:transposase